MAHELVETKIWPGFEHIAPSLARTAAKELV